MEKDGMAERLDVRPPVLKENPLEWYRIIESLRSGDVDQLRPLLLSGNDSRADVNKRSAQFGPLLNVAVALAPRLIIDWLLKQGAYVNCSHTLTGETPLHVAAKAGRVDIVDLLLAQADIDDGARDIAGLTPRDIAKTKDIRSKIEAQQAFFIATTTAKMHQYASATAEDAKTPAETFEKLRQLFAHNRVQSCVNINHSDPSTGATVLHEASKRADVDMVRWLLVDRKADPFVRDKKGKYFYEVSKDDKIKAVFKEVVPNTPIATAAPNQLPRLAGTLYKWTNYASGYKARWFTLEDGILSYYKNQDDVPNSCRGSIHLKIASLWIDVSDRHRFDIIGKGSIRYHLRAEHVAEAQRWIMATKQAKTYIEDKHRREREKSIGHKQRASLSASQHKVGTGDQNKSSKSSDTGLVMIEVENALNEHVLANDSTGNIHSSNNFGKHDDMLSETSKINHSRSSLPSRPPSISDSSMIVEDNLDFIKPPHAEIIQITLNSARTQLDLQRSLLENMQSSGSSNNTISERSEILQALIWSNKTIQALFDDYARMTEDREAYWNKKYDLEHERKNMWEDSLAKLSEDYNAIEKEAQTMAATLGRQAPHPRSSLPYSSSMQEIPLSITETPSSLNSSMSFHIDPSRALHGSSSATAGPLATMNDSASDWDDDTEEFFDAVEGSEQMARSLILADKSIITSSLTGYESVDYSFVNSLRTNLPVDHALLRQEVSLWSVLRTAIGKDFSRITLPVYFNEPISMVQRMCEDIEYSQLLDLAWSRTMSDERLLFISAFAMSNYSSTVGRTGKPFNSLLGETFEYVRKDRGFRYVAEQVSHHPPISACFCETDRYEFFGEAKVSMTFRTKAMEIHSYGTMHVNLKMDHLDGGKEHYTWEKVTTAVHNIIVGKPWIDHYGDMTIHNHKTGERVVLTFKPTGWRNKNRCEIEGKLFNAEGKITWEIWGRWDEKLSCKPVGSNTRHLSLSLNTNSDTTSLSPDTDDKHVPHSSEEERSKGHTTLWRRFPLPVLTPSNFMLTPFALTLNQLSPWLKDYLCPTDCRLRPDQRAMEDGQYDRAAEEKSRLEEKQREVRKMQEELNQKHTPQWFLVDQDPDSSERYWRFTNKYWQCRERKDWKSVPDIY